MLKIQNYNEIKEHANNYFTGPINRLIDSLPLLPEYEAKQIENLRATTIDVNCPTEKNTVLINKHFPSGTFLFHSAKTSSLVNILRSGSLLNGSALASDQATNGGSEAISWSLGGIEAMPATRYHIAGFVVAPESAISSSQLAVPDRAAPYEVTQVASSIEPVVFYDMYAKARQLETEYHTLKETEPQIAKSKLIQILAIKAQLADVVGPSPAVAVPVDKMFFVSSKSDLPEWERVIVRCGIRPAGIIAYDNTNVFMEDFVQTERGHGTPLYEQLRRTIPLQPGKTIGYSDVLGKVFSDELRNTAEPHTLDDIHRLKANTVRLGNGVLDIAKRKS